MFQISLYPDKCRLEFFLLSFWKMTRTQMIVFGFGNFLLLLRFRFWLIKWWKLRRIWRRLRDTRRVHCLRSRSTKRRSAKLSHSESRPPQNTTETAESLRIVGPESQSAAMVILSPMMRISGSTKFPASSDPFSGDFLQLDSGMRFFLWSQLKSSCSNASVCV